MNAEIPAPDPSIPPKGIFPPAVGQEITGLIRQDREDLLPTAFSRLEALGKQYENREITAKAKDVEAEQQYEAFTLRYIFAIAPGIGGALVGEIVEKPVLTGVSILYLMGVAIISMPKILKDAARKGPDENLSKASQFLKQAVAKHPGRPTEVESKD